ncbi:MAG TPA: g-type lysozyme inhibitor [Lysobacter sp.]
MKPGHTFALSIAFALVVTSAVAADMITTVPVKFAKGASSATIKGSFAGYDSVHYTLDARAGQTMTVTLAGSSNANFNVFAPGDAPGAATALGSNADRGWTGKLPKTGTYTVQVYQMRASARRGEKVPYTITVSIR